MAGDLNQKAWSPPEAQVVVSGPRPFFEEALMVAQIIGEEKP